MYKIGTDIPAGEYKAVANSDNAYVEVSRDSSHSLDAIISNDGFTNSRLVSVSNGQYLTIIYGYITK